MTSSYFIERNTLVSCFVTDTVILDLKDAIIEKEIIYKNNSPKQVDIDFKTRQLNYSPLCQNFKCFINDTLTEVRSSRDHYNQVIEIKSEPIVLGPDKDVKIKITCVWNNFHNIVSDFDYVISHPDSAEYRLTLLNYSLSEIPHIISINGETASEGRDYHNLPNEIRFEKILFRVDNPIYITLLSLSTPKVLPVFSSVISTNKNLFISYTILFIQHLLSDSIHLVETFNELGADKEAIFIIGIPYSTKHTTVRYFKKKGYNNIWAPLDYPFIGYVETAMSKAIDYSREHSKKIIIVEDGGYAVPLLHSKFTKDSDLFIGAVEQTANGIWLDKDIKEKDGIEYIIPIINVAESRIKKDLESPLIGRAVSKNIELMINKSFQEISGKNIGIIGLGNTGIEVAKGLSKTGANITIFDTKKDRIKLAKKEGNFIIGTSTIDTIKNNEIIIEATGKLWETDDRKMRKLILSFRHGSYFFSGSSKRLGINHNVLKKLIDNDSTINIPGFGKKYKLTKGKEEITLIADGFPVNFFLGESVPDKSIAFILAWLYKSAEIIALNHTEMEKGIIDADDSINDPWGLFKSQNEIRSLDEDLT